MAGRDKVVESVRRLAMPALDMLGYELVDLTYKNESGRWYLRFFIDKPDGIGINDCEAASREVSALLEVEDVIAGPYVLEVSSPGLDRPLFMPRDYIRFAGKLAKVRTLEPIDGKKVFSGRIDSPDDKGFNILTEGVKPVFIEYARVEKARLEVEF